MRALFLLALLAGAQASLLSRVLGLRRGSEPVEALPLPVPSADTSFLLSFESDEYDHCKQMHPVLERLERDLGTVVRRVNVARRREFMAVLEAMGHNDCGTLPFYFNRRTGQAICGATTYSNLKRWGVGDLRHNFMDPPESVSQSGENNIGPSSRKGVGSRGLFMDKMQALERRGKARTDAAARVVELRKASEAGKKSKAASGKPTAAKGKEQAKSVGGSSTAAERMAARKAARTEGKIENKK